MSLSRAAVPPTLPKPPEPVPRLLRDLVREHTGIFFETDRLDTMIDKLEPRAIATGCQTYLDYYYILKYDERRTVEWRRVMDAFSVQETYFWREFDQVRALVDHVVPAWFRASSRPLRIWSAACATGEEPYTIVMALHEAGWGDHPIEVRASDDSESALAKARAGLYRDRSFRSLPSPLRDRYFDPQADGFLLKPEIMSRVQFHWANLVALENTVEIPAAEVIFCRNVFIYFSPATIRRVATSFAARIPAGGHLFIGSSESLLKLTAQFDLQELGGAFVYVRNST